MKVYFAGSIRGGRQDAALYGRFIDHMKKRCTVLTEHVGAAHISLMGEETRSETEIHDRDMEWLNACDAMVAEVTQPSLGVGYEIGRAVEAGKGVLCLFRQGEGRSLSAMIAGCGSVQVAFYSSPSEAERVMDAFLDTARAAGEAP
jgi:2'-deoxynucleoside 5'-phosphate N-hydrolase